MACHKTLKAGDDLYIGEVRIRAGNKTSLSVNAAKDIVIMHASEIKSQETPANNTKM